MEQTVYELEIRYPNISEVYLSMLSIDKNKLEDIAKHYIDKADTIEIHKAIDNNLLIDCIADGWEWRGFCNQMEFVPSTTFDVNDSIHSEYKRDMHELLEYKTLAITKKESK